MRKNYIIATAGHVDHGKTTLIKALTGKDCDTHPEEKRRGITIHLGFSHLELSKGKFAGIIDVPGHKDFIDTMISGINGIDLVLFIVSADESFMPQTFEHLNILNMLGVKKGIIILTKCDLVDSETLFFAKEEIREKVKGTFLEKAKILHTSVISKKNLNKIKPLILKTLTTQRKISASIMNQKIIKVINTTTEEHLRPFFRFYPDRFFQVQGFGSVVTGTVLNGNLKKNQTVFCVPNNSIFKIRRMESYGFETDKISKGQRASINLMNFQKNDFEKGVMLCNQEYNVTSLIDVQLELFDNVKNLEVWTTVELYTATIKSQAKIHLMDKDKLFSGEKCFAQIHLEKAIPVCFKDKFIIRNTSGIITLGGGVIIDAFPLHHRRRTEKVKELLVKRITGKINDLICSEIEKSIKPISLGMIKQSLKVSIKPLTETLPDGYTQYDDWFWIKKEQDKLEAKLTKYIQVGHKNNPLDQNGKNIDELASLLHDFPDQARHKVIKAIMNQLINKNIIEIRYDTYALASHKVKLTPKDHTQINWVEQFLLNQKMRTPLWSELTEKAFKLDIDEKKLKQILFYLVNKKKVVQFEGEYLHNNVVNPVRLKLLNHLADNEAGCTVGEFRDLIDGNRKICVILLNIFDAEGIILRIEDKRYISEKGRRTLIEK